MKERSALLRELSYTGAVPEGIPWEDADTSLHLQMQAGGDAPAEGRG